MRIGELARATRCQAVTIRYYERIGLLPPPERGANNYRRYGEVHRRRLAFVRRSRELGFSLDEVRELLRLSDGGHYTCDDIRALGTRRLTEIRARLQDLQRLEAALADLLGRCRGGATPDCSMLEALFDEPGISERPAARAHESDPSSIDSGAASARTTQAKEELKS